VPVVRTPIFELHLRLIEIKVIYNCYKEIILKRCSIGIGTQIPSSSCRLTRNLYFTCKTYCIFLVTPAINITDSNAFNAQIKRNQILLEHGNRLNRKKVVHKY